MRDFVWFIKHSFSYRKGYSVYSTIKGMPNAWTKFNKLNTRPRWKKL